MTAQALVYRPSLAYGAECGSTINNGLSKMYVYLIINSHHYHLCQFSILQTAMYKAMYNELPHVRLRRNSLIFFT